MARNTGREQVLFPPIELAHKDVVASVPKKLYHQERDWTCSVACIRTLLSGITDVVESENYFIVTYKMLPGPHYSRDIADMGIMKEHDVIYGCDVENEVDLDMLLGFMNDGYLIMVESMYNYSHWMVLLGYYPLHDDDIETAVLLMYDPYYDEVRLINADEFTGMWADGDYEHSRVEHDFIAVRSREKFYG